MASGFVSRSTRTWKMPLRAKITASGFPKSYSTMEEKPVKFSNLLNARIITLNRPKKLNSLNHEMVKMILPRLQEWNKSDLAKVIIMKGEGDRSLCAGGDIAALAQDITANGAEGSDRSANYFLDEYSLDHYIASLKKPYISFMDGVTMGGGVGLSVHAPFRIATERTLIAMPETNIGFFPDVAGSFFLSRLDGELGAFMGLTSHRLKGYEAFLTGLATHYVESHRLEELEHKLSTLEGDFDAINNAIEDLSTVVPNAELSIEGENRKVIDECFKYNTVEEIFTSLESNGSDFAKQTLSILHQRSPMSLKVTLSAIRKGKTLTLLEQFKVDCILADNMMFYEDFAEGVTALLLTKPSRSANWKQSLSEITDSQVSNFFEPRPNSKPFTPLVENGANFTEYPTSYGLPSEKAIRDFVVGDDNKRDYKVTAEEVVDHFRDSTGKLAVEQKVKAVLARCTKPDPNESSLLDWIY